MRGFWLALVFLSTLPVAGRRNESALRTWQEFAHVFAWFPLVGFLLGGILVGADWFLGHVFPPTVTTALLLMLWVALTGALHLDGLVDTCDALFAPRLPEERMQILKDVHVGAFGVVGVVLLLLLKFAALRDLEPPHQAGALLLAPMLSRWAMVYAAYAYPYARPEGLGALVRTAMVRQDVIWATVTALVGAGVVAALWQLPATWLLAAAIGCLVTTWGVTALLIRWTMQRIPGLTGDLYGAINELVELVILLVCTFL